MGANCLLANKKEYSTIYFFVIPHANFDRKYVLAQLFWVSSLYCDNPDELPDSKKYNRCNAFRDYLAVAKWGAYEIESPPRGGLWFLW
jgi:hypothetical protein